VFDGFAEKLVDPEQFELQWNRPAFETGEIEQIGHELAKARGLGQRHTHGLGIGVRDAVDDVLEHRVQSGDRCAQLV
jgi:hypothetical protein